MVKTHRPSSLTEALEIRASEEITVFAGGSDLMVRNREWSGVPPGFTRQVLFVGHLKELQRIGIEDGVLKIGSACTLDQILNDKRVSDHIKLPISHMASPAVRNIATIGGNICNASPAGDTLPMLYALDAQLTIKASSRTSTVSIGDFITGPGQTVLDSDEILCEVAVPLKGYSRSFYRKVGQRKANCVSKVSIYALADVDAHHVHEVRIGFGAIAPTVVRSTEAERMLRGVARSRVSDLLQGVRSCYTGLIDPIDDTRSSMRYRRVVSLQLLERFLLQELANQ